MQTNTERVIEIPAHRGEYGKGGIRKLAEDRFQISYYDLEGRRVRKSYSTQDEAEDALSTANTLKKTGKLDPKDARVKVDALAESYKTNAAGSTPKSYDWIALVWRVHLEPFFGGRIASRVTTDLLLEYRAQRLAAKASPSTVNRELAVLRAMFYLGADSTPPKISRVPKFPEKLREPDARAGFVEDDDYEKLLAACKHHWLRALLALGYNFGFRKSELLGMRVSQIDLKARTIRLLPGTTKNDKGRTVHMTDKVFGLIAPCVEGKKPGDAVFTWNDGRPVKDFRSAWATLTMAAGVPDTLVHDLRRSAVRRMIRRGISRVVAKKISGHVTDSVFDRYDITDGKDLQDAARLLE